MKVICSNAKGWLLSDETCNHDTEFELVNGNIYEVIDAFITDGYCWYVLKEDFDNSEEYEYGWSSERFIANKHITDKIALLETPKPKKKWYQKLFS